MRGPSLTGLNFIRRLNRIVTARLFIC